MLRFEIMLKKFGQAILTLFVVATFNFILFRILPGDPVKLLARSGHLSADAIARLRQTFGLDKPILTQFSLYLKNICSGEFGISFTYRRPVAVILQERMINTLILLAFATVIVVIVGVAAGVLAASKRGSRVDGTLVVTSLVFWSLPTFWVGLVLVIILGVFFNAFPISGMFSPGSNASWANIGDLLRHLVLPTITLALVDMGQFVLISRSSLVDVLTEDYILTAKAKGLSRREVLWKHGVPNALLPIITTTALYGSLLVGGAIQVETVFSWPGMGRLMYDAVLRRDYPLLESSFLIAAVVVILANFLSDIVYLLIDPRVKEA
jgi:peptide/nickel transport system permease protein